MIALGPTAALLTALPAAGVVVLDTRVEDPAAQAAAMTVEAYVSAQIAETWAEPPGAFEVRLTWPGPDAVRIRIDDGERTWVDRPLEVADPDAARALVWLLVRSTIERVGLRAAGVDETPPIPRVPPAPPEPTDPAPSAPEPPAPSAPEPPAPSTTATVTEAPSAPAPPAAAPAPPPRRGLRRLTEAPFRLRDDDQLLGAVSFRGVADPSSGLGWGPVFSSRLVLGGEWVLGAEVGWRREQRTETLRVNHIPISVLAGYRLPVEWPVELGVSGTLDPREVSRQAGGGAVETTSLAIGIQAGVYARTHYTLWQRTNAELRLVASLGTRFGLLRAAYLIDGGREQDAVVSFDTALGVEWRWR